LYLPVIIVMNEQLIKIPINLIEVMSPPSMTEVYRYAMENGMHIYIYISVLSTGEQNLLQKKLEEKSY
jgi:hypothetical protein